MGSVQCSVVLFIGASPVRVILSGVEGSLFKAPSGRELPTESGEGEGVRLGDCLDIASNLKQGISVILSGTEWSRRIS